MWWSGGGLVSREKARKSISRRNSIKTRQISPKRAKFERLLDNPVKSQETRIEGTLVNLRSRVGY